MGLAERHNKKFEVKRKCSPVTYKQFSTNDGTDTSAKQAEGSRMKKMHMSKENRTEKKRGKCLSGC